MIDLTIPGFGRLELIHLVCDYNGTLAQDGVLLPEVARAAGCACRARLRIHVVTGDTFGTARSAVAGLDCTLVVLPEAQQAEAKRRYIETLDAEERRRDRQRSQRSADARGGGARHRRLGGEGSAVETLAACTLVVKDVRDALDLLDHPTRLTATLRA